MSIDITDLDLLPQTDAIALADVAHIGLATCSKTCLLITNLTTITSTTQV